MKRSTIWIIAGIVVVAVIALIVGLVVSKKHGKKDNNVGSTTVDEANTTVTPIHKDDWLCVFSKGSYDNISCPEGTTYIPKKEIYNYANISSHVECSDIKKKEFGKWSYHEFSGNDTYSIEELKCNNASLPCISKFQICVRDPNSTYPLIKLECKYVKDFSPSNNKDMLRDTQNINNMLSDTENITCGACGEEQNTKTYIMDSGFPIVTKIFYNCDEVRIEKAVPE